MSNIIKRKIYVTFPTETITDAIICDMYDKYKVRFNIRSASVNDSVGLIALELEAEEPKIIEAIEYFRSRGLTVEPIEMNVMAG
ncbi:MAG: hypothetical protein KDK66_01825 [Deltaproteobacteria bacterium]|nr:hypothetical protein [Deltaproteobacteria bacterium]